MMSRVYAGSCRSDRMAYVDRFPVGVLTQAGSAIQKSFSRVLCASWLYPAYNFWHIITGAPDRAFLQHNRASGGLCKLSQF